MNKADDQICQLIEDVISGKVSDVEFRQISRELHDGASREAMDAWHTASHYLDDADIRERDADYAREQIECLRRHVGILRGEKKTAAE